MASAPWKFDMEHERTRTIHVLKVGLAWLCISAICVCDRFFVAELSAKQTRHALILRLSTSC